MRKVRHCPSGGMRDGLAMGVVIADRCRVPYAFWIAVERLGLRPAAVLRRARLHAAIHPGERSVFTTPQVFALLTAVEKLAGEPGIGLRMIAETETASHPPFSLAAFHARNFRDALQMRARFQRLSSPKMFRIGEQGGECAITIDWLHASAPTPAVAVDMDFASLVVLGRRGTGRHLLPRRVEVTRPGPKTDVHERFFGCGVRYGAPRDVLVFSGSDLDLPFPGRNPELLDILWPALISALGDLQNCSAIRTEVKLAIKRGLASGRPDLSDVAGDLGMSERTLQRRITQDGTTFRELLLEARQELGRQLLADPAADIDAVACLLGYQDTSSFYRAFREWEGMTPRRWRELRGHAAGG